MDPSNIANLVADLSNRYSVQVLAALGILAAGFVGARIVGRFVEQSLRKTSLEKHLQHLLVRAAEIVVRLFTAILALDKFGEQITGWWRASASPDWPAASPCKGCWGTSPPG